MRRPTSSDLRPISEKLSTNRHRSRNPAVRHYSRSYLSFMGKAVALDEERRWLADQHQDLLDQLSPYDLRGMTQ